MQISQQQRVSWMAAVSHCPTPSYSGHFGKLEKVADFGGFVVLFLRAGSVPWADLPSGQAAVPAEL